MSKNAITVVIADDHEIFRDGFKAMIRKHPAVEIIGEAANGDELIRQVAELQPDIVITDIHMPKMDGLEATREIARRFPFVGIIALSMSDQESSIVEMLEAGAKGYLLKNAPKEEIIEAIMAVQNNHTYYCTGTSASLARLIARSGFNPGKRTKKPEFSEKEIQVMRYICEELTTKEIAANMHLSVRTIEGYRDRIQEKINAKNSAGIVVYAIRNKIYDLSGEDRR
ncbi:MAG TPA: response regulator transcription factor [Flavisolibacter sp.]